MRTPILALPISSSSLNHCYKSIGKKQVAGKLDKGSAYTHFSKEYKLLIAHEKVPALLSHRTVPIKATM